MSPSGSAWLLPAEATAREGWQLDSAQIQARGWGGDTGGGGGLPVPRGGAHRQQGAASLPPICYEILRASPQIRTDASFF